MGRTTFADRNLVVAKMDAIFAQDLVIRKNTTAVITRGNRLGKSLTVLQKVHIAYSIFVI